MAPKHKDLGKAINDHFNKDFSIDRVSAEVKQTADSSLYSGPLTLNFALNKKDGSFTSSGKSEMTIGRGFPVKYIDGLKYNEQFSPDTCDYTSGFEKTFGGAKLSYSSTLNLNDKLTKDVSSSLEGSGEKWNTTLKFLQEDAFSMPNAVIGNLVFSPLGKHNFGAAINYNIATKAIHHAFSLEANHPTGSIIVTLKDAKSAELGLQQNINKSVPVPGFGKLDIQNCYLKANCQLDANPDIKADIGIDFIENYGAFKTQQSKMKYNVASNVVTCSQKVKFNDTCDINFASAFHLPTFSDFKIGAHFKFNV